VKRQKAKVWIISAFAFLLACFQLLIRIYDFLYGKMQKTSSRRYWRSDDSEDTLLV
jgi:hypothetical protein